MGARSVMHCPTCGHEVEEVPAKALAAVRVTGQCRLILTALIDRYPAEVAHQSLWVRLYSDRPDGGPDNPGNLISVQIGRLRHALTPYGWTVSKAKCGTGSRGRYRLEKI